MLCWEALFNCWELYSLISEEREDLAQNGARSSQKKTKTDRDWLWEKWHLGENSTADSL